MKKTTFLITAITFLFVGFKNLATGPGGDSPHPMSGGAPTASTGAPEERHCSATGCHSDFKENSGAAILEASVGNGSARYEPGKTYPVNVSISNPGLIRFGFQVVALRNSDNSNVGGMNITDEARTQILPGFGMLSDRRYVTYTYEGTNCVSTGLGKWQFEWTAPETAVGDITLYIAAIAANDDGTDAGDYAYSTKIQLEAPAIGWNVFPTVSSGKFCIQAQGAAINQLKVYNVAGNLVEHKTDVNGLYNFELSQPTGVYFLSATQNGKTDVRKIVISR